MTAPLLQARALHLALPDLARKPAFGRAPMKTILQGIDLRLERGAALGVIGESGSGKSTLARVLTWLAPPQQGDVLFEGRPVRGFGAAELLAYRARMQLVFQDPMSSLNPRRRVGASITQPLRALGRSQGRADEARRAAALLERVGLAPQLAQRWPHELSGGQRQRVAIARALVNNPAIILADEPTGNLDSKTSVEIMGLFEEIHRNGNTIILVTHEEDIALHAHRIVRLKDGLVESDNQNNNVTTFQKRMDTINLAKDH